MTKSFTDLSPLSVSTCCLKFWTAYRELIETQKLWDLTVLPPQSFRKSITFFTRFFLITLLEHLPQNIDRQVPFGTVPSTSPASISCCDKRVAAHEAAAAASPTTCGWPARWADTNFPRASNLQTHHTLWNLVTAISNPGFLPAELIFNLCSLQICRTYSVGVNMLSDHTYSAKCSRCEICPDCGLDPKSHYKQEEVPTLLTSKLIKAGSSKTFTLSPAQSLMYTSVC